MNSEGNYKISEIVNSLHFIEKPYLSNSLIYLLYVDKSLLKHVKHKLRIDAHVEGPISLIIKYDYIKK